MTRKEYQHIASILARMSQGIDRLCADQITPSLLRVHFWESFVPNVADELADGNTRFDREKFLKACQRS